VRSGTQDEGDRALGRLGLELTECPILPIFSILFSHFELEKEKERYGQNKRFEQV
jgi:hypothetical protein